MLLGAPCSFVLLHRYAAKRSSPALRPEFFRKRSPTLCGDAGSTPVRPSVRTPTSSRARAENILIDSPRYARELVTYFANAGGIAHILLSHQDDVADASKFAERFGARVWIHHDDRHAAPYASDLIEGASERAIVPDLVAIPVPGHTRGSVVFLFDNRVLFTGDSLAWSMRQQDLVAFRDACWYSWSALTASLAKLAGYRFEWVLPGHGWPAHFEAGEMKARLQALVARMRKS